MENEEDRKPKKTEKTPSHARWVIRVFLIAVALSAAMSLCSGALLEDAGYVVATLILLLFIALGIMFDIIGVAVTAANPKPFNSMAAHRVKGAKEALYLIRNAEKVASFCNDVVGAICGIVMIFSVDFIDHILKIDDPVGASSVHGVCGCLGTILTGLFATEEGLLYGGGYNFLLAQLFGTTVVGCWAAGMGYLIFKGLDKIHGLRVPNRIEEEGLDIYEHGESAYN